MANFSTWIPTTGASTTSLLTVILSSIATQGEGFDNHTYELPIVYAGGDVNVSEFTYQWTWEPFSWHWSNILQLILSLIGIIGNSLVMLVLFRSRRKRYSTDTLITGLAVADCLASICLIPYPKLRTVSETVLAELFCRFVASNYLTWTCICSSSFILLTIAIEKMVAIRYPFVFQRVFTWKFILKVLTSVWIFSIFLNSFTLYLYYVHEGKCLFGYPSLAFQRFIGVSVFLVEYLIPVSVLVCAHTLTIRALRVKSRSVAWGSEEQKRALKLLMARRRVMEMLLIVIVLFIICWTPDQFFFLAYNLGFVDPSVFETALYRCIVIVAFANCCVNPIIYAARNRMFRIALQELCGKGVRNRGSQSIFAGIDEDNTTSIKQNIREVGINLNIVSVSAAVTDVPEGSKGEINKGFQDDSGFSSQDYGKVNDEFRIETPTIGLQSNDVDTECNMTSSSVL